MKEQRFVLSTDEQLVAAYVGGDCKAFDTLLERYQSRLFAYILSIVKNTSEADDIFQETFMKVVTVLRSGGYNETGRFAAWLWRVARNISIDYFRRKASLGEVSSDDSPDCSLLNEHSATQASVESVLSERELTAEVRDMIRRLPREQRQVVAMRFYAGRSFKEIASVTGVSINTALGRMHYAMKNLRRMSSQLEFAV